MTRTLLLPTQRNDVHGIIQDSGMNHSEFKWEEKLTPPDVKVTLLYHKPSDYYFAFVYQNNQDRWAIAYTPGYDKPMEREGGNYWGNVLNHVNQWLSNLKQQVGAPDLWAIVTQETALLRFDANYKDRKFNRKERRQVYERLDQLEQRIIKTHNVTEKNAGYIRESFEYLKKEAKKQKRRNWFLQLIGILVAIGFQIALQPEGARELFRVVGQLFNQFLSGHLPLP